nr:integrase, catalytic region, zinc finger, CCHC-type, peptidase aspartic, catalytic [Tanacetum cinerariifolium]
GCWFELGSDEVSEEGYWVVVERQEKRGKWCCRAWLIQRGLQAQVRVVRTDKGTEFLNQTLHAYFAAEGIHHQTDGENLDKMKEKGDECIFVGYSTQSRAYRVFNKRTKVIMESIHVNFDELPQQALVHNSTDPALTRQTMASVQNSTDLGPSCQTKASVQISSDPALECQTMALEHGSLSPVRVVRTDKGTKFLNQTLHA